MRVQVVVRGAGRLLGLLPSVVELGGCCPLLPSVVELGRCCPLPPSVAIPGSTLSFS